jgi:hypothetical protein
MLVEVRLWRFQGRRLQSLEVENGRAFKGELRLVAACGGGDRPVQALLLIPGGNSAHLLAPLHEPIITLVGHDGFVLRGIERVESTDGVYGVVQEWRCNTVSR